MSKIKPVPQTISAFCGYCHENNAEIIMPDRTLSCKACAEKQGLRIEWKISQARLKKIYAGVQKKMGKKITLWQFAVLLGIETANKMSAANYVARMMRGDVAISASATEEALKLEQLEGKYIAFLVEQINLSES